MGSLKNFAHVAGDWKPQRTSGILRWCNKGVPTLLGVLPSPAFLYLRSSGWMLHQKKKKCNTRKKRKRVSTFKFWWAGLYVGFLTKFKSSKKNFGFYLEIYKEVFIFT